VFLSFTRYDLQYIVFGRTLNLTQLQLPTNDRQPMISYSCLTVTIALSSLDVFFQSQGQPLPVIVRS